MDAVEIGAYLTVGISVVIVIFLVWKGVKLINQDPEDK